MAKIVNKNDNASTNVNGIEFTEQNGFMVSVKDVSAEDQEVLVQIPGFFVLPGSDEKPVSAKAVPDPRIETAERRALEAEARAEVAEKRLAEAQEAIAATEKRASAAEARAADAETKLAAVPAAPAKVAAKK